MPKKAAAAGRLASKKTVLRKKGQAKRKSRAWKQTVETEPLKPVTARGRTGGQSGDLQGLSDNPGANSQSVDELLEEGNSLEAEVVEGVEEAADPDIDEVRTHEVPEDDVPEEYDDQE